MLNIEKIGGAKPDAELDRRGENPVLLLRRHEAAPFPPGNDALAAAQRVRQPLLRAELADDSLCLRDRHARWIIMIRAIVKRDERLVPFPATVPCAGMTVATVATVAKRIVQAREAVGWSQAQLGEAVNAAQSTVATWERGKNEPDLRMIARLAKKLNKTPEWLAFAVGGLQASETVAISEIDVRAEAGAGGLIEAHHQRNEDEVVKARYFFPERQFRDAFGADPRNVRVIEVTGDSMLGTLNPGEKVFIDVTDQTPSPPGIFIVWDGLALVVKRVEFVAHSDPPRVTISSDNPRYKSYERLVGEAYIQGRVIGSWHRR